MQRRDSKKRTTKLRSNSRKPEIQPLEARVVLAASMGLNFDTDTGKMLEDDSTGLCDTNNDGTVSPTDALLVINAINGGAASESILTGVISVSSSEVDSSTESSSNSSDGTSATETSSSATTESLRRSRRIAILPVDALVTKYDADASGGLTETEVPSRLWKLFVASTIDADADANVTLAELQTAVTTARQELFNSKDSNSDGQIVSTEVDARLWSKLVEADTDANESASLAEFEAWIASRVAEGPGAGGHGGHHKGHRHGQGAAPELWRISADALFDRFDADSDQVLTDAELPTKILDDLIEKGVDSNSDGSITSDELATAVAAARASYFTDADSDTNGQLTETEAGARAWRKLNSADSDSNGTISLDELQAWVPTKHTKVTENSATTTSSQRVRGFGGGRRR